MGRGGRGFWNKRGFSGKIKNSNKIPRIFLIFYKSSINPMNFLLLPLFTIIL
jgi:hypothetical protein